MKKGEFIEARTHAEFLNEAFGTNYKAWMKSSWEYCDGWVVWMAHFNTKIDGWENTFISDADRKDLFAIIKQENLDGKDKFNGIPIEISNSKKRIVFEIVEIKINGKYKRKYVFRGKYVYDETKSDPRMVQYLNKISDEF